MDFLEKTEIFITLLSLAIDLFILYVFGSDYSLRVIIHLICFIFSLIGLLRQISVKFKEKEKEILSNSIFQNNFLFFQTYLDDNYRGNLKSLNAYSLDTNENIFIFCIKHNRLEFVEYMLENGFSANFIKNYGEAPLVTAVRYGRYNIFKLLLNFGANPVTECPKVSLIYFYFFSQI
jgi:hypothetical protein